MRHAKTCIRRGLALWLAVLLTLGTALAAETTPEERQEDLDFLYHEVLEKAHPNAFSVTPEADFLALKAEIESRLGTESQEAFLLDLMALTALAGDSHTSVSVGSLASFRGYPFTMIRRGTSWYLTAVTPENEDLLCREITALAGRPVDKVIAAYGRLFPSDNPVHLRRQFRQASNVADIYEYLGLVEAGKPLAVTLAGGKTLSLEPMGMAEMNALEAVTISDRITAQPETAARNDYYWAKPLTDKVYYIQYNTCQENPELPMEDFAAQVKTDLDGGDYSRILLDFRNNTGGSDGVIWPLFEVLRAAMDGGCEVVGLIGESTFSSALINAVEIQEMGGVLAGEATGGSVAHFGAVHTFTLPNSKIRGQVSSKYIDLSTLLDAGAGRGVEALEPDVAVSQTLEDTLAGKDTLVDYLLAHLDRLSQKEYPDAPLTRGRFVGLLYEAVGSPAAVEEPPFADCVGMEWYLPALVWAKENGIAQGTVDGTFSAARPITWREAAVFLARTTKLLGMEPNPEVRLSGPVPAALAQGWAQAEATAVWDLGLLPTDVDFTQGLTRAQGEALVQALAG